MNRAEHKRYLIEHGMYDPSEERDACGVGFVAAIDGQPRREIVTLAIDALKAVWHRGAVDADGKTGDGAGIHLALPELFFRERLARMGQQLHDTETLAVGMVFLPKKNLRAQEVCRSIIESEVLRFGYRILGWRRVPIEPSVIGDIANDSRPEIEQVFIGVREEPPAHYPAGAALDDEGIPARSTSTNRLYIIRRRIEKSLLTQGIRDCYIPSLSSRSIIYKGLFKAEQLAEFYPDLKHEAFTSNYAIFHQRFSTNTEPAWALAQPFRCVAHNGEINTIKGNTNFMRSHEATMQAIAFAGYEADLCPVIADGLSDTGALDAVFELLVRAGHAAPLTKQILIPPAMSASDVDMPAEHRAMYRCLNTNCEPWDGPAAIAATDGRWVIAGLDRGGLRPMRFATTRTGLLVVGSESGMVPIDDADITHKGRLGPGDTIGVDLQEGRLYFDRELKDKLAADHPYDEWARNIQKLDQTALDQSFDPNRAPINISDRESSDWLRQFQLAVGLTFEEMEIIINPMAEDGKEAVGSMGDHAPLAVLSDQPRGFHHYFRQNFSQVTNPPIDSLRERRVMSLFTRFGNDGNFLSLSNSYQDSLLLESPVLLNHELSALTARFPDKTTVISALFDVNEIDPSGEPDDAKHANHLRQGIDRIIEAAEQSIRAGRPYLILTDEHQNATQAGIPMILAVAAINSHLIKRKLRKRASIIVRSAECCDVHHLSVLIGVGATIVNPWLVEATILERHARGLITGGDAKGAAYKLKSAFEQGLLKIMSKMGISIVSSYRNGFNFEAIGLSRSLVAEFFPSMPSKISGIGLQGLHQRILVQHRAAFGNHASSSTPNALPIGGFYKYRANQERQALTGPMIHTLQSAVASGSYETYKHYTAIVYEQPPTSLRHLLDFASDRESLDLQKIESIHAIRKRFVAPAMSLGALSPEAHEILAIACNRMGAQSNSGEGGEGSERYLLYPNGDNPNSVIKQVASARFGVTAEYLNAAEEIQIKVAQGAKPGEGGQLPAFKVTTEIARLRHATPGVSLISPPPHHDIYSIEDLAQLIYDLKQINPFARVSVKLVSQAGIGTIASGVAKAMADKIIIAGHAGGTGASPYSSIKFAGSPWEMGLAEVNQVLSLNRLRHRVRLQTDGGLKTGRDIVIAALLGAEEYAIGTASLVAMGCIMVRQCHSNTCPVGICTQDPALRAKFEGTVEKVIHLFSFIAEEVREWLAYLGYSSLDDIIGRSDLLRQVSRGHADLVDLDLNPILARADSNLHSRICTMSTRNEVLPSLDDHILAEAGDAIRSGQKIQLSYRVQNTNRSIGTRLSSVLVRQAVSTQRPADQLTLELQGSAGQSLGAFLTHGIRIELYGDANDYVGKGLCGGVIILRPRLTSHLVTHDNTILGNTALYGATSGTLYAAGQAGERFAVRNSGATTVIEGCGSNGCEYMTGGLVIILGSVGYNFAAGMSGGMAFVYDEQDQLTRRLNTESVVMQSVSARYWRNLLRTHIEEHHQLTASPHAAHLLAQWDLTLHHFKQICPKEMIDRLDYPLQDAA